MTRKPQRKTLPDNENDAIVTCSTITSSIARLGSRMRWSAWLASPQGALEAEPTDLRLLNVLDGAEPLSVNEISRRALVDQAWVSRSLRTLEAGKLVERSGHPADSRLTLVTLTQARPRHAGRVPPLGRVEREAAAEGRGRAHPQGAARPGGSEHRSGDGNDFGVAS